MPGNGMHPCMTARGMQLRRAITSDCYNLQHRAAKTMIKMPALSLNRNRKCKYFITFLSAAQSFKKRR